MPIIDKHTNIVDCAIHTKGSMEALFDLVILNYLSITDDLVAGNLIVTPEGKYPAISVAVKTIEKTEVEVLKKHQTLLDYTVQHSGALNSLFNMAQLNGLTITQDVVPGTLLKKVVSNKKVVYEIKRMGVDVVSNKDLGIEITIGGIGTMQIGNTFKTS